jgi:hypothetical protein
MTGPDATPEKPGKNGEKGIRLPFYIGAEFSFTDSFYLLRLFYEIKITRSSRGSDTSPGRSRMGQGLYRNRLIFSPDRPSPMIILPDEVQGGMIRQAGIRNTSKQKNEKFFVELLL